VHRHLLRVPVRLLRLQPQQQVPAAAQLQDLSQRQGLQHVGDHRRLRVTVLLTGKSALDQEETMDGLAHRFGAVVTAVLPRVTAQAACTEGWWQYRCVTCGGCKCRQRRWCRACNGVVTCGGWQGISSCACGGPCC
jgi:hypothetical protein